MKQTNRVERMVKPMLEELGFELVQIQLLGKKNPCLQVMAEPISNRSMSIADCESISHTLSTMLDVEDLIPSSYTLEVSSPGLDRPLVRLDHFERFKGHEALIETSTTIGGSKNFRAHINGVIGDNVMLEAGDGEQIFAFNDIKKAKLIVTDEMLTEKKDKPSDD